MNQKIKTHALNFHKKGYRIAVTDANKRTFSSWSKFQKEQTEQELTALLSDPRAKKIGVICTDGLEVIDIDSKYDLTGQLLHEFLKAVIRAIGWDEMQKITMTRTVSGGAHLIYKTNIREGNQKLAQRETVAGESGNRMVLIETRAQGGYFIVPPSEGYEYDQMGTLNGQPCFAQLISDETRNKIIAVAKTFDELSTHHTPRTKERTPVAITGANKTTIEAFNEAHTPYELLEGAGWQHAYTRGDNELLVRPGKKIRDGISASYNTKLNLAYIFSSSTEFVNDRAYNAFQVYSVLNHGGDYSEAAKELYRAGYGERLAKTTDTFKSKAEAITENGGTQAGKAVGSDKMDEMFNKRFSIHKQPEQIDYNLTFKQEFNTKYNIAAFGDIVTIVGAAKSRKSALGSSIVASSIAPMLKSVLNFTMDNRNRNVLYFDTEQSEPEFYKVQNRMFVQAGLNHDLDNYYAFNIGEFEMLERLAFINHVVQRIGDVGTLFIDGVVDLCEDYNDQVGSRKLVGWLKKLAIKNNCLIIAILHNARSTGDARGHLGTELINKSKAVIQVTKNDMSGGGTFSSVNFKYTREAAPPDFDFTHDANGNLITGTV